MLFLHGFTSVYGSLWKLATNAKFQLRISKIICPWSQTTLGHGVYTSESTSSENGWSVGPTPGCHSSGPRRQAVVSRRATTARAKARAVRPGVLMAEKNRKWFTHKMVYNVFNHIVQFIIIFIDI